MDDFNNIYDGIAPAGRAFAITPNNDADLANATRAIYVGGAGDITVNMADSGSGILFTGVPAGTLLPIRVVRVLATGTDATSLVAVF